MNLCSVEIIEYVIDYLGNDIPTKMILFLKDDCNIDIQSTFLYYDKYNQAVCNVIYNGKIINSYTFTQNSEAILVELFNIFIKEEKIKIKEKIIEIRERNKKNNPNINSKSNKESINIYNNSVNNNSEQNQTNTANINININNQNNNTANASINQNITIKSTIEDINKIPDNILDKEAKEDLEEILYSIEVLKDKEKDKAKEKIFKVLKYIIDKGFEVGIAIFPYLWKVLKILG